MTRDSRIIRGKVLLPGGFLALALAFSGCDREQIKVQQVPKDADSVPGETAEPVRAAMTKSPGAAAMPANPHAGMDMGGMPAAQPQVKWTLPDGWQEKPLSEMRVGSFSAPGKGGDSADVAIIPLPSGGPQMELANLNMWRSELKLSPVQTAESDAVTVGSDQGKLFDVSNDKTQGRILVAVLDHDGVSWYFKMQGADAVVSEQKPAFLQFLKSISFESAPAPETAMSNPHAALPDAAPAAEASASAGVPLPAGWKEVPATEFLLAKYMIYGDGGSQAEVSISSFGGTGGGVAANITRWRGQLGLPPLSDDDLSKQVRTLELRNGPATVVDISGTDKAGKSSRLIGVIAPQINQTWFYKLIGDPQIVEQQKDAFTKFVQAAKFSNAP